MVDIAAEKGVPLTVDEAKGFLKRMDDEEEFDDVELDAVALAAVAMVRGVERVVELWGRRPGMHPMRKWLFGRQPVAQTENLD